jgi:hypothetical protein
MLKRFAGYFAPLALRELFAQRDFEIIQSDSVSMSVEDRHHGPQHLRQMEAALPGQLGN